MTYTHIINSFSSGDIENLEEQGTKPEHIETQISHVFLFPDTVYKICKRDNTFFNTRFRDLSDIKIRKEFYRADFFENNYFSPNVYVSLYGIVFQGNSVLLTEDIDTADDIVMKMKRINMQYNLSNLLHEKKLTEEDCKKMGYQQTSAVSAYPHQPLSQKNFFEIFQARLDDLRDWMSMAPTYFSPEETEHVIQSLRNYVEQHADRFYSFDTTEYVVSLDNHSDNIFYKDKKMFFLDIYPPKEEWMTVVPVINMYRPATDMWILMGEEYGHAFLAGCQEASDIFDDTDEVLYLIYSAAIQGVSLHMLSTDNPQKAKDAHMYKQFITTQLERL